MVNFRVAYRCNTCDKTLAVMGDFDQLNRVEIPIDGIRCSYCNDNNRCIVLIGPDQPEYSLAASGTITLLSGCTLYGPTSPRHTQIRVRETERGPC